MNLGLRYLPNGVRVLLVPIPGVQSIAVGVYIGAGSREESWETNGIAHFLEHMVFKGTKKFPTRKQTSILEGYGSIQNGYTYSETTAYWAKTPADKWKLGLEVQKDLALYPLLRKNDLEKERGVILEEIHRRDDAPEDKVWEIFYNMRFPNQSLGWSTLGRPEVIERVNRDSFAQFHQKNYVSSNLAVVAAGKIGKESEILKQIEEWFGDLPKKSGSRRKRPKASIGAKVSLFSKMDAKQAHFVLGVSTFDLHDERQYALMVLNRILGFGTSGRLFTSVRDKRGLAYAVYSDYELEGDHGYWAAYSGVRLEKTEEAIRAVLEELRRIAEKKVPAQEFMKAKEKVRGPMLFAAEDPHMQMEFYAKQVLWRPNNIKTIGEVINRVMEVTAEDVQRVAREFFVPERLNLAIVGPFSDKSKFEKLLKI
ncbi:MAG: insulinase family protein [Candidatus Blackburnbacteria bacterium]|nr:insulinase family protein [Candidatus Blackburnbacteria bacterium]